MFFGSRSAVDTATRSDARHQAEIKSWWRDWHRYLHAQLQLLQSRQAEATVPPSFERTDQAWEQQRAEAEHTLRRVPHDRRAVFDRTRELRRAEVQAQLEAKQRTHGASHGQALDPDLVERETLERLIAQAEGSGDGVEQWGAVPLPNGWYELEVAALLRAPTAAEYTLAADDGDDRRKRLGLIACLLLVGIVGVWWTWPRSGAAASAAPVMEIAVNGQAAPRWSVGRVIAIDGDDQRTTLPVTATEALVWPTSATDAQGAWWRTTALHPLQLCVPAVVLHTGEALELESGGDVPLRRYTLGAAAAERPDLIVDACGPEAESDRRYGVLQALSSPPDQTLRTPATIGTDGPALRVEGVAVIGGGQDPQLPPDNYRVVVRVVAPPAVDWTALDPRLVLETGLELRPSAPIAEAGAADVVEVPYLAPAWQTPIETAWSISDPQTNRDVRWRITLDPPRSRAAMLRDALDITVAGRRESEPDSGTVILHLRNTSATSVVVKNDDLTITQGDRRVPVTALGPAGIAITPLEARTLEVPLRGIDLAQAVSVRIGTTGFQLRWVVDEGGAAR